MLPRRQPVARRLLSYVAAVECAVGCVEAGLVGGLLGEQRPGWLAPVGIGACVLAFALAVAVSWAYCRYGTASRWGIGLLLLLGGDAALWSLFFSMSCLAMLGAPSWISVVLALGVVMAAYITLIVTPNPRLDRAIQAHFHNLVAQTLARQANAPDPGDHGDETDHPSA